MRQRKQFLLSALQLLFGNVHGKCCRAWDWRRRSGKEEFRFQRTEKVEHCYQSLEAFSYLAHFTGRGPVFRKSDQPGDGFEFHSHVFPCEYYTYVKFCYSSRKIDGPTGLPRPVLIQILKETLQPKTTTIHTSKRLLNYERDPTTGVITLTFSDGSTATADCLIGADGVHSATRASIFRQLIDSPGTPPSSAESYKKYIDPIWSGMYAYRCTVPADKLKESYPNHAALGPPKIVRPSSSKSLIIF